MSLKVGDQFTVPLCVYHHDQLHKGLGESEMRANASNEFKSFLAKLSKARKEYLEAKMMYDSFINWTRLLQSRGANLRAEMNMTGSL